MGRLGHAARPAKTSQTPLSCQVAHQSLPSVSPSGREEKKLHLKN